MLHSNTVLMTLNLDGAYHQDTDMSHGEKHQLFLQMSTGNEIGSRGVCALAQALEVNTTLTSLGLSGLLSNKNPSNIFVQTAAQQTKTFLAQTHSWTRKQDMHWAKHSKQTQPLRPLFWEVCFQQTSFSTIKSKRKWMCEPPKQTRPEPC